jgi:hypothetical protein
MDAGSKPADGGGLCLSRAERDQLLASNPEAMPFIRSYLGSVEFLSGAERFCLWIHEDEVARARAIPFIDERVRRVEAFSLDPPIDLGRCALFGPGGVERCQSVVGGTWGRVEPEVSLQ